MKVLKKGVGVSTLLSVVLLTCVGCGNTSNSSTYQNSSLNHTPIAKDVRTQTDSGVVFKGQLEAFDNDGDPIVYEVVSPTKHGDVSLDSAGRYIYTPQAGFKGEDSFSYVVKDALSTCPKKSVTVTVGEATPALVPHAVTNLKFSVINPCKVRMTWDDKSDNESGFTIYQDGKLFAVLDANTTEAVVDGMGDFFAHNIEVRAKNAAGESNGIQKSINTEDHLPASSFGVPLSPRAGHVVAYDAHSVRLAWKDVALSETSYEIYQDGKFFKSIKADSESALLTGLKADTKYTFIIKPKNSFGEADSPYIHVKTASTGSAPIENASDESLAQIEDFHKNIPIDSNIDFGNEKGVLYYVDPRKEENGFNRALRIDYKKMTFTELAVKGVNPHSIDRAGRSDKFYIRTQNSNSFDVVNFKTDSVKSIALNNHKPRSIGASNEKYHLQLVTGLDMPVVDVLDTVHDRVLATVGNQTKGFSTRGDNAGSGASGHAIWLDTEHFALIDRVAAEIRVYKVTQKSDGTFSFDETSRLATQTALHTLERVADPKNTGDLRTLYGLGEGNVAKKVPPFVLELRFDAKSGQLKKGRKVIMKESLNPLQGIKPTTHHAGISPDGRYFYVPVLDGKVYVIERETMKTVKILKAQLGAAHIEFSASLNMAIVTNHFSEQLTAIDLVKQEVIEDVNIGLGAKFDPANPHLLQPHFSYMSKDGKYYYTFSTQKGTFLEINLETLTIERELKTGGAPEQAHS